MSDLLNTADLEVSLETMLLPDVYFKRNGIRVPSHLAAPRLIPVTRLELPSNSMLHYVAESESELGPSPDNALLKNVSRLVFVSHQTELKSFKGNPRRLSVPLNPKIVAYRNKYRKLRLLTKLDLADREPKNLIVINYALLPMTVRYVRSYFTQYHAWYNLRDTVIKTMVDYLNVSKRDQYLVMNMPRIMPSLNALRRAESAITRDTLKGMSDINALDLLDLYTWLSNERYKSLLAQIPNHQLHRVNIVVKRDGVWFVVNLGVLNEWRKLSEEDLDPGAELTPQDIRGIAPKELAVRVLRMFSKVYNAASLSDNPAEQVIDQGPESPLMQDGDGDLANHHQIQEELEIAARPLSDEELEALETDLELDSSVADEELVDETVDEDGNIVHEALSVDLKDNLPAAVGTNKRMGDRLEDAILSKTEELASVNGLLSLAEYKRLQKLAAAYKDIKNPYTGEGSLADALVVNESDLMITPNDQYPDMPEVFDKSMLQSTIEQLDKQYINNCLNKDIVAAVLAVQNANIAVTGYEIERVTDAVSDYERHIVQLTPVVGRASTIQFRVPVIKPTGTFVSNGTTYHLRKQRVDLPIRKVSPIRVALTSDYGNKLFVETSERATYNYDRWLVSAIRASGNSPTGLVKEMHTSSVADLSLKLPRLYTLLSENFVSFEVNGFYYYFDHGRRFTKGGFDSVRVSQLERDGIAVIARKGTEFVVVDKDNTLYAVAEDDNMVVLGRAEDVFGLPMEKAPVPMAELQLSGKNIPVGVILSYLIGLDALIRLTKATTRRVPMGERLYLDSSEFAVRFFNESIIFRRDEPVAALLFNGFNLYHNTIRNYSSAAFNKKDIYLNVLEAYGLGVRYLREFDLMMAMFIDPITKRILNWMGEPEVFDELLIRAVEMLTDRHVPEKLEDGAEFVENLERIRGYERVAGAVYGKLVESIRLYNGRMAASSSSISMNPHAVWIKVVQDPAAAPIEQTNPIRNLKEKEVVTFGGHGGRSRRSMVASTREVKVSDIGMISEAGVDSGDVGIIAYASPNTNVTTVYGTVVKKPDTLSTPSSLLSTSALLAPSADRDDPKRVNFIGIQQAHGISCIGARAQPLRTGYEQVIAHRVDELWATTADKDGEVVLVTDKFIRVQYSDGEVITTELGRQFGLSAGTTYPSDLATFFKVGDKVKKGDVIAYNSGFFEPNEFGSRQVVLKAGVLAKTAFLETNYTLEDSCAISLNLMNILGSHTTKVKTLVIPFFKEIRSLVSKGESVSHDSILCMIEDPVTARANIFDEQSIETLRLIEAQAPRANVTGVVEKIEVFYNGDVEDMTESLQELAAAGDRERRKTARALQKTEVTGLVDQSLRIEGEGLDLDNVAIRIYITSFHDMGIGDKAVFCNQMKTTVGHILVGRNETKSGVALDAVFGYKSLQDRIVLSALIIGMTNTLLRVISERAALMYFDDDAVLTTA